MIRDARVFDTQEYVPGSELVVAREGELTELSHDIELFLRDRAGGLAIVDGPPGAGKTMLARYLLEDLRRQYWDVTTAYVNCWDTHSESGVLSTLLAAVGDPVRVDQRGTALFALRERLADATADQPLVAVLDEATQLDALATLWGLHERENVYILLITNDRDDLLRPAGSAEVSRLRSGPYVRLPGYSVARLVTILERRAEVGLVPGTAPESVLRAIAEQVDGDARRAIEALKQATQQAHAAGAETIPTAAVPDALSDATATIRQRNRESLKPTQQILLDLLDTTGEWMAMGELHEAFCARTDDVTQQTLRRHLRKLGRYNLVELKGSKRGRRYRAVKR